MKSHSLDPLDVGIPLRTVKFPCEMKKHHTTYLTVAHKTSMFVARLPMFLGEIFLCVNQIPIFVGEIPSCSVVHSRFCS